MTRETSQYLTTVRGDRLRRPRWDRLYWHLRCLRDELEVVCERLQEVGGGRLVDYGCGNLPYRPLLEKYVESYLGADLPGNELADLEINEQGRIDAVSDSSVDLVLSSQVLEHVTDPNAYLNEARRILRNDGLLILSTHGVWQYHPDPTDFWRWTSSGLRKLITDAGFEIDSFRGVMGPLATGLQLMQDAVFPALPRLARPLWVFPFQIAMQLVDRLTSQEKRNSDASVYVVVAKRIG